MKNILLVILASCMAWSCTKASEDKTMVEWNDDMPEFCAAALLVIEDSKEYHIFEDRYELRRWVVMGFRRQILDMLNEAEGTDEYSIIVIEIEDAAAECKDARREEMEDEDQPAI